MPLPTFEEVIKKAQDENIRIAPGAYLADSMTGGSPFACAVGMQLVLRLCSYEDAKRVYNASYAARADEQVIGQTDCALEVLGLTCPERTGLEDGFENYGDASYKRMNTELADYQQAHALGKRLREWALNEQE